MQENNSQDFLDDKEIEAIEVSDLPENNDTEVPRTKQILLGPRFSLKQRKRQALLTLGIALIALMIFLANVFPLGTLFSLLNPAAARLSGPNLFYFQSLPSWGSFSIDGRPLAQAPTVDSGPPVKLAPGNHRIEWYAEPFVPLTCTLAVASSTVQQTCHTRTTGSNDYTKDASVIEFPVGLSLEQLPNAERQALTGTIQSFLNELQSNTVVQPGERYAYNRSNHSSALATRELRATQRFLLDTDTSQPAACAGPRFGPTCSMGENDCRLLCTLNWPVDKGDPRATAGWHVAMVMRPTWEYTPLDGSTLAPEKGTNTWGDQYIVALQITRIHKSWHVSFHPQGASSFDDPNCIATIGLIMSNSSYLMQAQQRITWTFTSGSNRASGCLASATLHSGATLESPLSHTVDARILYRFGQLLAADDMAHQLWSHLPLASKQTQGIALDIGEHAAFVS